jgi:hypothetical protein
MIDNSPPDRPAAPDSFDPAHRMTLGSSDSAGPAGLPGLLSRPADRIEPVRPARRWPVVLSTKAFRWCADE